MSVAMYQVAIIGAGQLGRRHLQGLVKSTHLLSVHVVDPNESSRRAVDDFITSLDASTPLKIKVHETVDELPSALDLVIIATTANHRIVAIETLLHVSRIRHLILEKFLFNDSNHYERASTLLTTHGITAWVNTPRRHFKVYRDLQEQNRGDSLLQFTVDGGDWGLCCNSVHFIDLVQFLSGGTELQSLVSRFDESVLTSKREDYVELTGELSGKVGSTFFTIRSIRNSTKPITLTLHYAHQTVFVAEGASSLWRASQGQIETETFSIPYQSDMTGTIADQLLTSDSCDLTPYIESVSAHLPLLRTFALHAGKVTASNAQCSIT